MFMLPMTRLTTLTPMAKSSLFHLSVLALGRQCTIGLPTKNGHSVGEIASAALIGAATNIIPAGAVARGASSVVGNLFSQAYDQCFSGVGDINWKQAAAAGLLGAANVRPGIRPFNHQSPIGNVSNQVLNEAIGQAGENWIANQL